MKCKFVKVSSAKVPYRNKKNALMMIFERRFNSSPRNLFILNNSFEGLSDPFFFLRCLSFGQIIFFCQENGSEAFNLVGFVFCSRNSTKRQDIPRTMFYTAFFFFFFKKQSESFLHFYPIRFSCLIKKF